MTMLKLNKKKLFITKDKDFKPQKSNGKFKQVNKLNPVDKNGKISNVICDSKLHWANKCPHKNDQNVNILEDSDNDSADNDLRILY